MFDHCRFCKPPKRHPGCQDHCPDGKADKAEYNEKKAAYEKTTGRNTISAYRQKVESIGRANKRKKGKRFWI